MKHLNSYCTIVHDSHQIVVVTIRVVYSKIHMVSVHSWFCTVNE